MTSFRKVTKQPDSSEPSEQMRCVAALLLFRPFQDDHAVKLQTASDHQCRGHDGDSKLCSLVVMSQSRDLPCRQFRTSPHDSCWPRIRSAADAGSKQINCEGQIHAESFREQETHEPTVVHYSFVIVRLLVPPPPPFRVCCSGSAYFRLTMKGAHSLRPRIFATGGHSGLGFEALKALMASPLVQYGCDIGLFLRDEKAPVLKDVWQQIEYHFQARPTSSTTPAHISRMTRTMDLSSLASVRKAANEFKNELQNLPRTESTSTDATQGIDILLLNAAVSKSRRETVIDEARASGKVIYPSDNLIGDDNRIETTACVNHVAHLVFVSTLIPTIAQNAKKGRKTRIVFTGSALHRSVKDVAVLDDFFAPSSHDSTEPWTLRETYAASKFLQMLGIRALRRRIEEALKKISVPEGSIEVVVVQPGFVPQTGLARESGLLSRLAMWYLLPHAPFATSLKDAGQYIANACTVDLPTSADEVAGEQSTSQDGFGDQASFVRSAMLEVHAKQQRFGTPDPRTADIALQDKWWPAACDHVQAETKR